MHLEKHHNLHLAYWAPPPERAQAQAHFTAALSRLVRTADELLVLGHRPASLADLPGDVLAPELAGLLRDLAPTSRDSLLFRLPQASAQQHLSLLGAGRFPLQQRALDEFGVTQVRHHSAGTLLLLTTTEVVSQTFGDDVASQEKRVQLSVLANPHASLTQREAGILDRLVAQSGYVVVMWNGNSHSFTCLAAPELLHALQRAVGGGAES